MRLGIPEIIFILIYLAIPTAIILVIVSYCKKLLKLKQEQVDLLRKIAEK